MASLNNPLEAHPSRSQKSTTERAVFAFYIIVALRTLTKIEKRRKVFGGTVLPNKTLIGGTVQPNKM